MHNRSGICAVVPFVERVINELPALLVEEILAVDVESGIKLSVEVDQRLRLMFSEKLVVLIKMEISECPSDESLSNL